MATIHQFDNNPEEDEFYLVEIYWFITYTLVEPSINQQFTIKLHRSVGISFHKCDTWMTRHMSELLIYSNVPT